MKTLFTAEAISKGGRSGFVQAPDWLLNITLGNSLKPGAEKRGPNPERLFAGAYSACYLAVELHAQLPGIERAQAHGIMDEAVLPAPPPAGTLLQSH